MIPAPLTLALFVIAPPTGGAGDVDNWLELDHEIAALGKAQEVADSTLHVGFDTIVTYGYSDDPFFSPAPPDDLSGFTLRRARLSAKGSVADWVYKVSVELTGAAASIRDAYVHFDLTESTAFTLGRFKQPLLFSGLTSSTREVFLDGEITAGQNDGRDLGVMVDGEVGPWEWKLAAQNGADGASEDLLLVARAVYNLVGDTAFGKHEGAYGYSDETHASVAVSVADDQAVSSGTKLAGEAGVVMDRFSLRGDIIAYDNDYDLVSGVDPDEILGTSKADTAPFTATLSYLFGEDEWELVGRFEDFDDAADTSRRSLGLVWLGGLGHRGKWTLIFTDLSSDAALFEGSRFEIGLTLNTN